MDVDTVQHVAAGNWLQLTSLNLSGNCVEPAVVNHLIKAPWLALESLTLEYCKLVAESLPGFFHGHWPKLHILNIAHNRLWRLSEHTMCIELPGLSKLGLAHTGLCFVSTAVLRSWSTIQHLDLENDLDGELVQDLMRADLSRIKSIGFDLFGSLQELRLLTSAKWPMLESLDLSRHYRSCHVVRALCASRLPCLECLYLSYLNFYRTDAASLVTSKWPRLRWLNLDYNDVNLDEMHACITTLMAGQWPLQHFSIRGNRVSQRSLRFLLRAGWSSLERSDLPNSPKEYSDICTGTVRHDSLEPGLVHLYAPRSSSACVLQHLKVITFSDK